MREASDLVQAGNARESLAVVREAMERVPEPARAELYFVGAQAHGALGDETDFYASSQITDAARALCSVVADVEIDQAQSTFPNAVGRNPGGGDAC